MGDNSSVGFMFINAEIHKIKRKIKSLSSNLEMFVWVVKPNDRNCSPKNKFANSYEYFRHILNSHKSALFPSLQAVQCIRISKWESVSLRSSRESFTFQFEMRSVADTITKSAASLFFMWTLLPGCQCIYFKVKMSNAHENFCTQIVMLIVQSN